METKSTEIRVVAGLLAAILGLLVFSWMAADAKTAHWMPVGIVLIVLISISLLVAGGFANASPAQRDIEIATSALMKRSAAALLAFGLHVGTMRLVTHGQIRGVLASVMVTGSIALIAGAALRLAALFRSSHREGPQYGQWLTGIGIAIAIPALGKAGLIDPWESQYGEVAREMLERNDWLTLFWGHEGWFQSKPVLDMWLQGVAMGTYGVHTSSGQMLEGGIARPEWAVRMPMALMSLMGIGVLYLGAARALGRRAAFFGCIALLASPLWLLLAGQSVTDMSLLGPLCAASGAFLAGAHTDKDQRVRVFRMKVGGTTLSLHAFQLLYALVLLVVLPQILYLISRNVELQWIASPHGFRIHADEFFSGSYGNSSLPGQLPWTREHSRWPQFQPALLGGLFALVLGALLFTLREERRTQRLYFLCGWLFASIATMGKGPAGLVIPAAALVLYLVMTGQLRTLLAIELGSGILIAAATIVPWYAGVFVRRGRAFTDELIFRNMIGRTLEHLHDTNLGEDTSIRYYLWQLGYALFPWIGLAPFACVRALQTETNPDRHRRAPLFFVGWLLVAFGLFSYMHTKFHYYIAPAVPPLAMLIGWALSEITSTNATSKANRSHLALMVAGSAIVALVGRDLVSRVGRFSGEVRLMHLFSYQTDERMLPPFLDFRAPLLGILALGSASLLVAATRKRWAAVPIQATGLLFALWILHIYLPRCSAHWGQREVFNAYYTHRNSENAPLIAYALNWKGENFYSGNQVSLALSGGASLTKALDHARASGAHEVFVIADRNQLSGLVQQVASAREVTDVTVSRQFALIRAPL